MYKIMNKKKVALCICLFVVAGMLLYIFSKRRNSLFEGFDDCTISIYPPSYTNIDTITSTIDSELGALASHPWTGIAQNALDPETKEGEYFDFNSPHYDCLKSQLNNINETQQQQILEFIDSLVNPFLNKVQNLVTDLENYISDVRTSS